MRTVRVMGPVIGVEKIGSFSIPVIDFSQSCRGRVYNAGGVESVRGIFSVLWKSSTLDIRFSIGSNSSKTSWVEMQRQESRELLMYNSEEDHRGKELLSITLGSVICSWFARSRPSVVMP